MKGFDDDWLTLREPFDHASRNPEVLDALTDWAADHDELRVLDLGGGTGSNFRFLAPRLGASRQSWVIVDHDPRLLAGVARHVIRWGEAAARTVAMSKSGLVVEDGRSRWVVEFRCLDLAHADDLPAIKTMDLVTASALLDLASADWADRIASMAAAADAGQYWALSYDGRIEWSPADGGDDRMRALFNRHQRTDKGFGPALGPSASGYLAARLEAAGRTVVRGRSDWLIGPNDRGMQHTLLDGFTGAALEIAPGEADRVQGWAADRMALIDEKRSRLLVGHEDLFVG